jgi:hypothetical protein
MELVVLSCDSNLLLADRNDQTEEKESPVQIKLTENGVTIHAHASRGTIYIEKLVLQWQHPIGPCEVKTEGNLALAEARTYLKKKAADKDSNPRAEEQRQTVIARAMMLIDWVETIPQSIPVSISDRRPLQLDRRDKDKTSQTT